MSNFQCKEIPSFCGNSFLNYNKIKSSIFSKTGLTLNQGGGVYLFVVLFIKIIIYLNNFRLEELHSLEYRRDAELFTDQEQRHMSQMQLHQSGQDNSIASGANSLKTTGKKS